MARNSKPVTPTQAAASNGQHVPATTRKLPSGLLEVEVAGMAYRLDLTELQLATEAVERRHGATPDNPDWYTAGFLRDLAQAYHDLGVLNCTPTQAAFLRKEAGEQYAAMRDGFFQTPGSHGATG